MKRLIAVFAGAWLVVACSGLFSSSLNPAQQKAIEAHECYAAALEPAVGPLTDDILRAVLAGGNLIEILRGHRLTLVDILAAAARWRACDEPVQLEPPAESSADSGLTLL